MSLNQYIPAGSEIVVLRGGNHEWYTTKKPIPVTETEAVDCPVRQVPVLSTTYMGFRIWFLDGQIRAELTPAQIQTAKNMRLQKLEYDIPSRVEGRVTHPSSYLWRMGVRTSWSCWLIPKGSIPMVEMRELTRAGCNWKVTPVSPDAVAEMMSDAVAGLQAERQRALRAADDNRKAAEQRFAENSQGLAVHVLQVRRRNDLKRIETTLKVALENVRLGASALGIPREWTEATTMVTRRQGVATAAVVSSGLSAVAKAEADAAGDVYDRLKALGTHEGNVVAAQVKNNTMPVEIAKDLVREREEENGVFSLSDGAK